MTLPEVAEPGQPCGRGGARGGGRAPGRRARRRGAGGGGRRREPPRARFDGPEPRRARLQVAAAHALLAAGLAPAFDSFLAAYLIDPGRPTYATRRPAGGRAGASASRFDGPEELDGRRPAHALAPGAPARAAWPPALEERHQNGGLLARHRAAAGGGAEPQWRRSAYRVDPYRSGAHRGLGLRAGRGARGPRLTAAGGEFAPVPKQLGEILSRSSGCPPIARARPATRPTSACWPPAATMHPIVAVVEHWRELTKLNRPTSTRCRSLLDPRRGASTRLSARRPPRRGACRAEPEPAEHPGAHAGGAARSAGVRRRRRGGLVGATTRRSSCACSRTSAASRAWSRPSSAARTCTADRRRGAGIEPSAVTPRPAQGGQGHQLRHHLRHLQLRPGRAAGHPARGGADLHRAVPRPLPDGGDFIERTIASADEQRLRRRRCSVAAGRPRAESRSTRRATRRAPGGQLGAAGNGGRHPQGRDDRRRRRAARRACAPRLVLQIHDELLLEAPDGEATRRARSSCAKRCAAPSRCPAAGGRPRRRRELARREVVAPSPARCRRQSSSCAGGRTPAYRMGRRSRSGSGARHAQVALPGAFHRGHERRRAAAQLVEAPRAHARRSSASAVRAGALPRVGLSRGLRRPHARSTRAGAVSPYERF